MLMREHLRAWWRRRASVTMLVILVALAAASAEEVEAHAVLERSEPAGNAVLPVAPDEALLWFTEPLEPAYVSARLHDTQGQLIETPPATVADDPLLLVLPLPAELPNGTYTIQWENISSADGHPLTGFFSFTIGELTDVAPVVTVPESANGGDTSGTLTRAGRWLGVLGVVTAVGSLFSWFWIIRPAARTLPEAVQARLSRRVALLARGGVLLSLLGVGLSLVTQARDAAGTLSVGNLIEFVRESHTGEMLALRLGLLLVFGALLATRIPWELEGRPLDALLAQGVGLGVLFQFALLTHATAQEQGQPAAVVALWLHLIAAAVWVGGLLALVATLTGLRARLADIERRTFLAETIARFSTLAISAVIIVSLSGLYAGWVHLGSLANLTGSDYGRTLLIKLALTAPLLGLGALNLLVVGPALRRAVTRERDFSRTVRVEAGLGAAVLLLAAILASTSPPQPTQAAQGSTQLDLFDGAGHSILSVSPGTVGQNQYLADVHMTGGTLPVDTQVLLRIARDDQISGIRELALEPEQPLDGTQSSARFLSEGSELSVVGDWQLELIIRRPGEADWRADGALTVTDSVPVAAADPPRRGFTNTLAAPLMLLAALGIVATIIGLRHRGGRPLSLGGSTSEPTHSEQ